MSAFTDDLSGAPELDVRGCCDTSDRGPALYNRPGLPALDYRIATHASALRRMLSALPAERIPPTDPDGKRPLDRVNTRAGGDPAITLLDAWAAVTDVLTFYQERIANEGYLRTATERGSVLELARAIGYELNPGVAASAYLAFTVDDSPGSPETVTVPEGVRVQSVPGQGQLPQTFETAEELEAHADRNTLRPQRTKRQEIGAGTTRLYLKGVNTGLQPGDAIVLAGDERATDPGSERWDFRTLQTVEPHPPQEPEEEGYTLVTWKSGLGHDRPTVEPADNPTVYTFRQRAALFGHNAPDWRAMPNSVKQAYDAGYDPDNPDRRHTQWPGFEIHTAGERVIDLDAVYPGILADSWLVLTRPGYRELYRVQSATSAARADFTLAARTTRIQLDTREHLTYFGLRATTVFAQSERLELSGQPVVEPVEGDEIHLDRLLSGLERECPLIVYGKRPRVRVTHRELSLKAATGSEQSVTLKPGDSLRVIRSGTDDRPWLLLDRDGLAGEVVAAPGDLFPEPAAEGDETPREAAFVAAAFSGPVRTTITLRDALENAYDRATVTVAANVARATHGETVRDEALGNGSGAANQTFALRRPPLTHVSAPTPSGARSTLQVRVGEVLWKEEPSLYGLGERDQSYTVRAGADGRTEVIFGDGRMGARPQSGAENVRATYRTGAGLAGLVGAGALTLLQTRPLGIRGVTNPLPASGAADPEPLEEARANAPLTVLTLDRIVSLRDFEDFARGFAGIGKARAVTLWDGAIRLVRLIVAGVNGAEVPTGSELYRNLLRAIDAGRDPVHRVEVMSYTPRRFGLEARVLADSRLVAAEVLERVAGALREAFAFERRAFGQPVTAAEAVTVMQGVEGVVAVDLERLAPEDAPLPARSDQPALLPARSAELLLLDPADIRLKEMAP